jgi:hypothetical protein
MIKLTIDTLDKISSLAINCQDRRELAAKNSRRCPCIKQARGAAPKAWGGPSLPSRKIPSSVTASTLTYNRSVIRYDVTKTNHILTKCHHES